MTHPEARDPISSAEPKQMDPLELDKETLKDVEPPVAGDGAMQGGRGQDVDQVLWTWKKTILTRIGCPVGGAV
jgi:hypothetical protein